MRNKLPKITLFFVLIVIVASLLACSTAAPSQTPTSKPPTTSTGPTVAPTSVSSPTAAPGSPAVGTKLVTLKAVSFLAKNFQAVHFVGEFAKRVNERSNGTLKIDWVGGAEVIPQFDQPQAVSSGVMDIGAFPAHWYLSMVPETVMLVCSELTPPEERTSGFYDYLLQQNQQKANMYYLGRLDGNTSFYMYMNKQVTKPADLVGQKIATGGVFIQALDAIKATGVRMDFSEIYTALQQGVVNGVAMLMTDNVDWKWYEVTKYWIDHPAYTSSNEVLVMNNTKMNQLSKEQQELLKSVSKEIESEIWPYFAPVEAKARQTMIDKGMKPITFSTEDTASYIKITQDARWNMLKGKMSDDAIAKLKSMVTKKK